MLLELPVSHLHQLRRIGSVESEPPAFDVVQVRWREVGSRLGGLCRGCKARICVSVDLRCPEQCSSGTRPARGRSAGVRRGLLPARRTQRQAGEFHCHAGWIGRIRRRSRRRPRRRPLAARIGAITSLVRGGSVANYAAKHSVCTLCAGLLDHGRSSYFGASATTPIHEAFVPETKVPLVACDVQRQPVAAFSAPWAWSCRGQAAPGPAPRA